MPNPVPLKPRRLSDRQEAFCQHYLTEPSGTRAAILAGFSQKSATSQASRMLTKANILRRIAELRHDRQIVYEVRTDSLLDKLEAVYHEAMDKGRLMAAIHAVAHQARLAGLLPGPGRAADAYGFLVADIGQRAGWVMQRLADAPGRGQTVTGPDDATPLDGV